MFVEDKKEEDTFSCRPPKGSTYLTIGQDLFSIGDYITSIYNASLHNGSVAPLASYLPASFMFYTDIISLNGTEAPVDYGSGIEFARGIFELFPVEKDSTFGIQIGLWISGAKGCQQVASGQLDDQIRKFGDYLNTLPASLVFLRIGYEFDNPYFGYLSDSNAYIAAFQTIVTGIRNKVCPAKYGPCKVKFVWHSWAASLLETEQLDEFYPGDSFVDWVGISIFQQVYSWANTNLTTVGSFAGGSLHHLENVLNFADAHDKPVMIAESTPFGGIGPNTAFFETSTEDPWQRWFEPVLNLIEQYDIAMWSYINCDWDSQPMWHNVGFGDTRVASNSIVLENWLRLVTTRKYGNRKFLMAGSLETCGGSVMVSSQSSPLFTGLSMQSPKWEPENPVALFVFLVFGCLICALLQPLCKRKRRKECFHFLRRRHYDTIDEHTPLQAKIYSTKEEDE